MFSNTFASCVELSNGLSKSVQNTTGIKQGDRLNLLLFCLYTDDLINIFDEIFTLFNR